MLVLVLQLEMPRRFGWLSCSEDAPDRYILQGRVHPQSSASEYFSCDTTGQQRMSGESRRRLTVQWMGGSPA